jgi:C4-dicarboxylate transporter DctQ subunit
MAADREPDGGLGRRLYGGLGYLGGAILALMTAAVFVQVVARYVFATAFDGIDEVPRYLFVWLVMIGAASAMWRDEHTYVEFFRAKLGARGSRAVRILTNLAAIGLFLVLIRVSFVLVPNSQLQSSPGLSLPLGYVYAAVPVGAVLMIIPLLRDVLRDVRGLWPRRS